MNWNVLVDIGLGIVSVMILFSLAATAIQEAIAQLLNLRGRCLAHGIAALMRNSRGVSVEEFYREARLDALVPEGSATQALKESRGGLLFPSAIEPRRYAESMLSLIASSADDLAETQGRDAAVARAKAYIEKHTGELTGLLDAAADATGSDAVEAASQKVTAFSERSAAALAEAHKMLEARIAELEAEFNQTMDRVSGWYARRTKVILFIIGLVLAGGAGIDLLGYVQRLATDDALREKAAVYAQMLHDNAPAEGTAFAVDSLESLKGELDTLGALSIGTWSFQALPGWILIAFATTLGAEFWYRLLTQLLNMRSSGRTGGGKKA